MVESPTTISFLAIGLSMSSLVFAVVGVAIAGVITFRKIMAEKKLKNEIINDKYRVIDSIEKSSGEGKFIHCMRLLESQEELERIKNNLLKTPPDRSELEFMKANFSCLASIYLNDIEKLSILEGISQPSERGQADYLLKYLKLIETSKEVINNICHMNDRFN
jgi:hypothetical protein